MRQGQHKSKGLSQAESLADCRQAKSVQSSAQPPFSQALSTPEASQRYARAWLMASGTPASASTRCVSRISASE